MKGAESVPHTGDSDDFIPRMVDLQCGLIFFVFSLLSLRIAKIPSTSDTETQTLFQCQLHKLGRLNTLKQIRQCISKDLWSCPLLLLAFSLIVFRGDSYFPCIKLNIESSG